MQFSSCRDLIFLLWLRSFTSQPGFPFYITAPFLHQCHFRHITTLSHHRPPTFTSVTRFTTQTHLQSALSYITGLFTLLHPIHHRLSPTSQPVLPSQLSPSSIHILPCNHIPLPTPTHYRPPRNHSPPHVTASPFLASQLSLFHNPPLPISQPPDIKAQTLNTAPN